MCGGKRGILSAVIYLHVLITQNGNPAYFDNGEIIGGFLTAECHGASAKVRRRPTEPCLLIPWIVEAGLSSVLNTHTRVGGCRGSPLSSLPPPQRDLLALRNATINCLFKIHST